MRGNHDRDVATQKLHWQAWCLASTNFFFFFLLHCICCDDESTFASVRHVVAMSTRLVIMSMSWRNYATPPSRLLPLRLHMTGVEHQCTTHTSHNTLTKRNKLTHMSETPGDGNGVMTLVIKIEKIEITRFAQDLTRRRPHSVTPSPGVGWRQGLYLRIGNIGTRHAVVPGPMPAMTMGSLGLCVLAGAEFHLNVPTEDHSSNN